MKQALFIPLKREFFEAFERGEKEFEYREYGLRWNERTCRIGRAVTLSMGYGKARRLRGVVSFFDTTATPQLLPGWSACYGDTHRTAAIIGITLLPRFACEARPPWDFRVGQCCARQIISTMDFLDHPVDGEPDQYVRRVCTKCFTRWEGCVGVVKKYTSAEWRKFLESQ